MQKRVLITGITGFAGSHLADLLVKQHDYNITGTHLSDKHLDNIFSIKDKISLHTVNLLDTEATKKLVKEVKPDVIFHLAASTHVGDSFQNPIDVITNNVNSQINVLEAVKDADLKDTRIVITSSSHTYGLVKPDDLPIDETTPFRPDNPYSISKITQDYLGLQYFLTYKLHIVRLRPFNHIGPRLSPGVSISRFAKFIAEAEKGIQKPVLKVGAMTTKRDFTDVRDMVRAYVLSLDGCEEGEAYNIGTGKSHTIQEVLDKVLALTKINITVESDDTLFRPSDIPELRCNAAKFTKATGWKPEISLDQTVKDMLEYWRAVV